MPATKAAQTMETLKNRAREMPTLTLVEAVTAIRSYGPGLSNPTKMARAAVLDVLEEREGEQFVTDLTDALEAEG